LWGKRFAIQPKVFYRKQRYSAFFFPVGKQRADNYRFKGGNTMTEISVRSVVLSFLVLMLAGCAEHSSELNTGTARGLGDELTIGSRFADFEFTDDQCKTRSLMAFRGDFTIIAFTSCDQDYNPALTHLADFVEERSNWRVRVVGVDVFWTPQTTSSGQICLALPEFGNPNFVAVHDRSGVIRNRYNIRETGRYFVIGPLGKIVAKGNIQDIEELNATLNELVDEYQKEQEAYSKEIRS
jgi:hypothetical protein